MCCCACLLFFFFKQKTAYEMRISDWSSDVCSSDLGSGQDLEMVGITPDRAHAALHIRIEGLAALDRLLRAEDHLGRFRRELPAGLGSAGLHDHRPALDRPRDVEWSTHREVRPLMIEQIGRAHV